MPTLPGEFGVELQIDSTNSLFDRNDAGSNGGAIHISTPESAPASSVVFVTIDDTEFSGNTAKSGGAIWARVPAGSDAVIKLDVTNSVFESNEATASAGGAINFVDGSGSSASNIHGLIDNNRFENNQASQGGAFSISGLGNEAAGPVRIYRNSMVMNTSTARGGAVFLGWIDAHMINNLLAYNTAGTVGGGLVMDYRSGSSLQRELWFKGNTFYQNTAGEQTEDPAGWNLHYAGLPDANGSLAIFVGNAFIGAEGGFPAGDTDCFQPDDTSTIVAIYNVMDDASCNLDGSQLLAAANNSLQDIVHPIHKVAAIPLPGSPLIDHWSADDCTDELDSPLVEDMSALRRMGGIPIDGDGQPPANCDAGASEAPMFVTDLIFGDGFE